jgi:hypothetical protein
MPKNTFSVIGGAMPKIERAALMRRAWAIFRQTYKYPLIKFPDIGRKCFGWALKAAWSEAREAVRVAAISPTARAERIEVIYSLIQRANHIDSGPQWKATVAAYRQEIRQLQALA